MRSTHRDFPLRSTVVRLLTCVALVVLTGWSGVAAPVDGHRRVALPESGLRGQTVLQACYHAFPAGSVCPAMPFQAVIEVRGEGGRYIATIRTDEQGWFRVPLRPGRYILRPQVMVTRDSWGMLNLTFPYEDSIPAVVPQGRLAPVAITYGKGFGS